MKDRVTAQGSESEPPAQLMALDAPPSTRSSGHYRSRFGRLPDLSAAQSEVGESPPTPLRTRLGPRLPLTATRRAVTRVRILPSRGRTAVRDAPAELAAKGRPIHIRQSPLLRRFPFPPFAFSHASPFPPFPFFPPATSRPFSALTRAISLTPTRGASSGGLTRGASSGALSRDASGSLAPTRAQLSAMRRAAAFQQQHPSCWPSRGRMQVTTDSFDFEDLGLTDADWMGDDGDSPASAKSPGEAVEYATSSPSNRTAPSDRNDEAGRGAEGAAACSSDGIATCPARSEGKEKSRRMGELGRGGEGGGGEIWHTRGKEESKGGAGEGWGTAALDGAGGRGKGEDGAAEEGENGEAGEVEGGEGGAGEADEEEKGMKERGVAEWGWRANRDGAAISRGSETVEASFRFLAGEEGCADEGGKEGEGSEGEEGSERGEGSEREEGRRRAQMELSIQDRATHLITIGHIRASLARPHLPRISMTFIPPLPPLLPQSLPSSLPNPHATSLPHPLPRSLLHATPPAPLSPLQIQTTLPNLQ
ncbi:unnamed protein product [Closterium sp. NIES-64]|nr:unnamed protein product [Closterium sp. NIES-64]